MYRAGTSCADNKKFSRIITPLNRYLPYCGCHIDIHDMKHPIGRFHQAHIKRAGNFFCYDLFGASKIKFHFTASKKVGIQIAKNEVRIAACGFAPSKTVAGRSGPGTRAFWTHLEKPSLIDPRNTSTACADSVDLHHRKCQRITIYITIGGNCGCIIFYKGGIKARASHIYCNEVIFPVKAGIGYACDGSCSRA